VEEWKAIEGTNGMIEVSNMGRVRSMLRDGRILKAQKDSKGYHRIRVTINGEKQSYKVHRAVAAAFLPARAGKTQVNHKDGNKSNNAASNLEWVSNAENARHAINSGLWENVFKASQRTNARRMTPVIAKNMANGETLRFESVSAAERYFHSRHISDVLNGKRESAAGHAFYREVVEQCKT
jgi:hypothetical protein